MAEIVGLVAAVLQLFDTVVVARDYAKDFRGGSKDKRKLLMELDSLRLLLKELHTRSNSGNKKLHQFREPLLELQDIMKRLAGKLAAGRGVSQLSNRITWMLWGKKDIQADLITIERFKALLNVWLAMDIWDAAQKQDENHDEVLKSIEATASVQREDHNNIVSSIMDFMAQQQDDHNVLNLISAGTQNQECHSNATIRDKIIEWWSPLNFFKRQAHIFATRQPGTGKWFLEHDKFLSWMSGRGKTLWCPGMPGAGKTVLASIAVNHLRETLDSDYIGIAAIYLDHKEIETQSPPNLLAGLWRQLVFGKKILPEVERLYAKHREPRTRPSVEDFSRTLRSTIEQYRRVYLVVDAVDEHPEEQRQILLTHLSKLGPTVSLMLTSRPHLKFDPTFPITDTLTISAIEYDVRQYVDAQILKSPKLSSHIQSRPDLREEIEEKIVSRSKSGMFLLAKFHIDSLTTKHTVKAVREALNAMPSDLESTYDEVMDRITQQNDDDRTLARSALSWISNARRPLRVSELREALAIEPGATGLDPENMLDIDAVVSVCAGLVIVDHADGVVRLVHYTTQHYLERMKRSHFPSAETDITTACITYLLFETLLAKNHPYMVPSKSTTQRLQNVYPFINYAIHYCLVHAQGQPESELEETLLRFLHTIASRGEEYIWDYWEFIRPTHLWPTGITSCSLWIATTFNLHKISRRLIEESPGAAASALHQASSYGSTWMVQSLIEDGAAVNAVAGVYGTALHAAVIGGPEELIRLLLVQGADVNARGSSYGTALQAAVLTDRPGVVRLLIDNGADVNLQGGYYGTALQAGALVGNTELLRLLIKNGADVNTWVAESFHGNALHAATRNGREDAVRLLLENGANADILTGEGVTPLYLASWKGWTGIVKLLIDAGADVNIDGENGTALEAATFMLEYFGRSLQWRETIAGVAQLLIERGADANRHRVCTALQHASAIGHEGVVRLLIDHGADVNLYARRYGTALQRASWFGHRDIVELLISEGADINCQGADDWTALHAASAQGHKGVVRLLIANGADINARRGRHGTALQHASASGHEGVVRLLIDHGADVNISASGYSTAIQAATRVGNEA
ncbi:ankyrin repeat-containing domain protein [Mycena latifolia]|nr:ankyrin repeat-containing domain protein [Mycena latifolia]